MIDVRFEEGGPQSINQWGWAHLAFEEGGPQCGASPKLSLKGGGGAPLVSLACLWLALTSRM